ncbi:Uncharacterised protein [Mycobacteroides abscessus subsp. abscessus]|nr:Uncharacterised protein [Mycobacteroides abscessus subsp. abscessus]
MQHPVDGKFTHYQVAGYARKVEHQRLDMELAMLGTHQLFFDVRKIAVMHIDIAVSDVVIGPRRRRGLRPQR